MNIIETWPVLGIICGPFGCGKTSALNYIVMTYASMFSGVMVVSPSSEDDATYEENYSWCNRKFVRCSYDERMWKDLEIVGRRIKSAGLNDGVLLVIDDPIGMASDQSIFTSGDASHVVTTMRQNGIKGILILLHRVQTALPPLLVSQANLICLGSGQTEKNLITRMYDNWGKPSVNLSTEKAFRRKLAELPPKTFLIYHGGASGDRIWRTFKIPHPLPKWRLYLTPEDKEFKEGAVIYGNKHDYILTELENKTPSKAKENLGPIFRKDLEDSALTEHDDEDDPVDKLRKGLSHNKRVLIDDEDMYDDDDPIEYIDYEEDKPKKHKKPKKDKKRKKEKKNKAVVDLYDAVQRKTPAIQAENLSREDQILYHRLILTFDYLKYEPNPDSELLNKRDPSFLAQDFHAMSFAQLQEAYRKYTGLMQLTQTMHDSNFKYNSLAEGVHQFARTYAPTINPFELTGHFRHMKHRDILNALASSNPFVQQEPTMFNHIMQLFTPGLLTLAGAYLTQGTDEQLQDIEQRAAEPAPEGTNDILNELPDRTTDSPAVIEDDSE